MLYVTVVKWWVWSLDTSFPNEICNYQCKHFPYWITKNHLSCHLCIRTPPLWETLVHMIQEFGITRGFYDALMDCDVEGAYSGNPRWPNGFSLHTPGNAGYGRKGGAFPPTRKPGDMIGMEVTDLSLCLFVTCLIPSMRWANAPHPSPASSLHGPEVGQPASLREFIISAQRSLFSGMLDIHTEGFFIIGLASSSCVHTEARSWAVEASDRRPGSPRENVHTPWFLLPNSWFQASNTSCLQGPWDMPASQQQISPLGFRWFEQAAAPHNPITIKQRLPVLHSPDSDGQVELKKGQEPGVGVGMLPDTPQERRGWNLLIGTGKGSCNWGSSTSLQVTGATRRLQGYKVTRLQAAFPSCRLWGIE